MKRTTADLGIDEMFFVRVDKRNARELVDGLHCSVVGLTMSRCLPKIDKWVDRLSITGRLYADRGISWLLVEPRGLTEFRGDESWRGGHVPT